MPREFDNVRKARHRLMEHLDQQAAILVTASSPFDRERYYPALDQITRLAQTIASIDAALGQQAPDGDDV